MKKEIMIHFRNIFCICLLFSFCTTHVQAQSIDTIKLNNKPYLSLPNKNLYYPVLFKDSVKESAVAHAIGYLKGDYLQTTPTNSPLAALSGRIAGLRVLQFSGEPGNDVPLMILRGRIPLMVIDGIPRSTTSLNPEQIESVTVLKDAAATAMLGMRGMEGAILITTKKGTNAKDAFSINFKAQAGMQTPLNQRQFLNSYDYARLYNEALANDGKSPAYSQADLDAYKNHTDPYGHPDVDWTKQLLKDHSNISRYTLNAEGAGKNITYFVSLDYYKQGGLFKQLDSNTYNTSSSFKRYIFRSNLDIKLSERAKVFLNLFGRVKAGNQPGSGATFFFSDFIQDFGGFSRTGDLLGNLNTTPNNAYPITNPNGTLGGNINYQDNLWGRVTQTGYVSDFTNDGFVDVGFSRNMDDLAKGWWIKATLSYNTTLSHITNRSKQYQVWQMNIGAAGDTSYTRFGPDPLPQQTNSSYVNTRSQQFYTELSTGISRTINRSVFDVLLLGSSDQFTSSSLLPQIYKGIASNIKYTWDGKYVVEFTGAYNGNNRFEPGKQYGFFPAAALAWNVNKESFLVKSQAINALKIRASYGLVGDAYNSYYGYIKKYYFDNGYVFGNGAGQVTGLAQSTLPYSGTWEKSRKLNVGIDMAFLKNKGWFSLDVYQTKNYDVVYSKGNGFTSALLGIEYPSMNLGKMSVKGFETLIGWADKLGKLDYNISANFSAVKSIATYNDEPAMPFPWMSRTGNVGLFYGYTADGFVTTAGSGPVVEGYQSVPGDIKYVDRNNDGVINFYDASPIGNTKPLLNYGFNANLKYNGFSLTFLIDGVSNNQMMLTGNTFWEFQSNGKGQAQPMHLNRWTPATATTADYPRLTIGRNINNHVNSTFWIKDLSFIRLRNVEIGYEFKSGWIKRAQLQGVRLFVNGLNLITISSYKNTYPEAPFSNYPVQRVINGGISIQL